LTTTAVTILITAYHEADIIGRLLASLAPQAMDAEVIVTCPDEETAHAAQEYPGVVIIRDPGLGKPAALNRGLQRALGGLIVMTDGDVYLGEGSLAALLAPFDDPQVGAVSGHPVSTSPRDTMLGYWSHLLTEAGAHAEREQRDATGAFFVCSGYLYAIRAGLVRSIPENALAEDAVISHLIGEQGYRIRYAPDALVYVKFPATYRDWLKQKVRSAGGYAQPLIVQSPLRMRGFRQEMVSGTVRALRYPRSLREMGWTLLLLAARLHLWLLIFWRVRIRRLPLTELWKRVESTK
jgi:cellulose synthase/poly-beta-1,6-N-acetylglucosamine synthase-like glycosyltransferase